LTPPPPGFESSLSAPFQLVLRVLHQAEEYRLPPLRFAAQAFAALCGRGEQPPPGAIRQYLVAAGDDPERAAEVERWWGLVVELHHWQRGTTERLWNAERCLATARGPG
jgi:hypothetical protein